MADWLSGIKILLDYWLQNIVFLHGIHEVFNVLGSVFKSGILSQLNESDEDEVGEVLKHVRFLGIFNEFVQ